MDDSLPNISKEQGAVVDVMEDGGNVIVFGNPGAGKTTLVLHMAKRLQNKRIVQLTFNKLLKFEVRKKAEKYGFRSFNKNDVHSYHSFGYHNYNVIESQTDEGLKMIVEQKIPPVMKMDVDILVIDEAHDMRQLLCAFVVKVLEDIKKEKKEYPQILLLGDVNQGVYEFLGSRVAFLTHFDKVYPTMIFMKMNLSTSYRLTKPMAKYVNKYLLAEDRIVSEKEGAKVQIITQSHFTKKRHMAILINIWTMIKKYKLRDDDIAILVPTLHHNSECKKMIHELENALVKSGHSVYFPNSSETKVDERVMKGKIKIITNQQSKGGGWPFVVVIVGIQDKGLYDVSSALYVAHTRASVAMTVVMGDHCPNWGKHSRKELFNCDYAELAPTQYEIDDQPFNLSKKDPESVTITKLTRFIPEKLSYKLTNLIDKVYVQVDPPGSTIETPSIIKVPRYYTISDKFGIVAEKKYILHEPVSHITSDVIMTHYDMKYLGAKNAYIISKCNQIMENEGNYKEFLVQHIGYPLEFNTIAKVTAAVVISHHADQKTISAPTVIENFSWLTKEMVDTSVKRLYKIMGSKNIKREVSYKRDIELVNRDKKTTTIQIIGRLDAISDDDVWEFKMVDTILLEHKIQLLLYYMLVQDKKKSYKLYNIKTGELYIFSPDDQIANKITSLLIINYLHSGETEYPDETISNMRAYVDQYL